MGAQVTAIEEAKQMSTMQQDELMGNLQICELKKIDKVAEEPKKERNLAEVRGRNKKGFNGGSISFRGGKKGTVVGIGKIGSRHELEILGVINPKAEEPKWVMAMQDELNQFERSKDHELLRTKVKDLRAHIERKKEASVTQHIVLVALITGFSSHLFLSSLPLLSPFLIHHHLPLDRPIHFFLLNIYKVFDIILGYN
ncbi:hypothetical protein HAX54_029631 [Datura stramonium]|uniref:Uncharacterized protein n=1 Tax=Datura stramonium TaxID=4076 RepID=A0ABS8V6P3_DATST|nr:hypothetical protein [Datura stramonium]